MPSLPERLAASRRRSLATVRRTIEIVQRVSVTNCRLADSPGHRESAERRVQEGHDEIAVLESERATLESQLASDGSPPTRPDEAGRAPD